MKALILVGGFGTRLRPLTLTLPKPLVPFANKPMILHQVDALVQAGVTDIVLAVNYRPENMNAFMEKYAKEYNVSITISVEPEPLGTAGPLALAKEILAKDDEPIFVLNSDIICDFPFKQMAAYHKAHGKEGSLVVTKVDEPSKYGVIVTRPNSNGQIERFVEKPQEFVSNKINAGLYLFHPKMIDRIKPVPTSIEKEIFPAMAAEGQLHAMELEGFWMDIGQPKDYILGIGLYLTSLQHHIPEAVATGPSFKGNVLLHPTAKIGKGCLIGPNVTIGPNVVIGDGVRISKSALFDGVVVRSNAWINNSIIGWHSTVGKWARIEGVTVLGEDVNISDERYINGARVLPHKSINVDYPDPEIVM